MTILRDMVQSHLGWKWRHIFPGLDAYEAQLRRRCLRDRLCRQAQDKYQTAVMGDGPTWLAYLKGARGKAHVEKWVDRKVDEVTVKWMRMGAL